MDFDFGSPDPVPEQLSLETTAWFVPGLDRLGWQEDARDWWADASYASCPYYLHSRRLREFGTCNQGCREYPACMDLGGNYEIPTGTE